MPRRIKIILKSNERRVSQRLSLSIPIKYRRNKSQRFREAGLSLDISGKGLRAVFPEALRKRGRLEVLLCPLGIKKPLATICRAIWCRTDDEGKFVAGLEFRRLKNPHDFVDFLCEKMLSHYGK